MQTDTTTPVPFGRPIRDLRSALEEHAALDAILEVANARRAKIRDYLTAADDAIRRAMDTGEGYAHEVPGVGTVTVTSPNRKAKVVDRDAFEAWAIKTYPDKVATRERVDWNRVEDGMRDDPHLAAALLALLDNALPEAVVTETLLPENLERDLLKPARSVILEADDGSTTVVVKDTGERIPGLEAPYASTPACRPKADPDLVADLVARLTDRLPVIETGEVDS